ncbi:MULTISPECIES: VOC family protein [Ornithinibacillus]|uniref:VOC family protein n=2 Tax=Ornithinibacillus TaxID=484508 RepID=A0A923L2I9_9BACI|nr:MULTISPECIES: VOC family protein [Ornithinibacillus]MBC5635251.1 VOC family protein [Ornithinibacillus hominis]MBS3678824.1 VOC family protein [Ornithinibacillus massiliensis]
MYRWDGGFIMVDPEHFDKAVEWYEELLGWKCLDKITSWVGRKAFMKMPRSGVVTIKSFEGEYEHFQSPKTEGNVRLGFATYNLDGTLRYLADKDVKFTEIKTLPNGQRYCDIFAFDNTKLAIAEEPRGEDEAEYPPSGIVGFGTVNTIIHVSDPKQSADWYEKHLGFDIVEVDNENGYAHLRTEDAYDRNALDQCFWDNIWLLQTNKVVEKPNDNKARTYYDIRPEVFFQEYNKLIKNGVKPSEIAGDPINGWGGFHIYDPDNNRINVWSYIAN